MILSDHCLIMPPVGRFVGLDDMVLPHGWGEMDYQTGSRYVGQWSRGQREGCGVMDTRGYIATRYDNVRVGGQF